MPISAVPAGRRVRDSTLGWHVRLRVLRLLRRTWDGLDRAL